MSSFVHQPLQPGEWIAFLLLVGIVGGNLVGLAKVITSHLRRLQLDDIEGTLKMEMIQRGMSPDEIKKVLQTNSKCFEPESLAKLFESLAAGRKHWRCRHPRQV